VGRLRRALPAASRYIARARLGFVEDAEEEEVDDEAAAEEPEEAEDEEDNR
jgi:hypothetical protein